MGNQIDFKIAGYVDLDILNMMVKLQVLGNNSKTVNNISTARSTYPAILK
jgi:hypothetical protein